MKKYLTAIMMAVVANFATAGSITFDEPQQVCIALTGIDYSVSYDDVSGTWTIIFQYILGETPDGILVSTRPSDVQVTGSDIRAYLELPEGAEITVGYSVLPEIVKAIAMQKAGITLP